MLALKRFKGKQFQQNVNNTVVSSSSSKVAGNWFSLNNEVLMGISMASIFFSSITKVRRTRLTAIWKANGDSWYGLGVDVLVDHIFFRKKEISKLMIYSCSLIII